MSVSPHTERLAQWTPRADDPVFAGHFPGNPLLPGALLIDWAISAFNQHMGWTAGHGAIRQAKFLSPARPDEPLLLDYAVGPRGRCKLQVTSPRPEGEVALVLELLVDSGPIPKPKTMGAA